jgi:hypothetical protein
MNYPEGRTAKGTHRLLKALMFLMCVCLGWTQLARADAVTDWNAIAVQTINAATNPTHGAPLAFTDIAIVQAAVYDAVQAIEKRYKPYHVVIPGASGSSEAAAAKAAHDVLVSLFSAQKNSLDMKYAQYLVDHGLSPNDPGVDVGATAAAGILALRANDGRFPPNPVPFVGGTGIGEWRPTESFIGNPPAPPSFSPMLTPWMANVTPFALKSGDQFRAKKPPSLTSHEYTTAYDEVKAMGARFNSARTTEQTDFALFWALNYLTAWNQVTRDMAAAHVPNIADSARLFALVTFSVADAGITAWDTKVTYNFWRPMTAIRLGEDDPNDDTTGDPDWQPLINNPNYPDYSSGANNATGAATRALALFFGTDEITFTVTTTNALAIQKTRTYNRFSDAAADVVVARIYQGIHFRFADEEARKQGRHVAQWVHGHFLKPLEE